MSEENKEVNQDTDSEFNPIESLKYFIDEIVINQKLAYGIELANLFSHILTRVSNNIQEQHATAQNEEEKTVVKRFDFNNWVLSATGEVAKYLFEINKKITDEENVDTDEAEGGGDNNQQ